MYAQYVVTLIMENNHQQFAQSANNQLQNSKSYQTTEPLRKKIILGSTK